MAIPLANIQNPNTTSSSMAAMNGNVQVMSNHQYSQRGGGGAAPQSSHYAASNSPAHYSGQQPPPPYAADPQGRGYANPNGDNRSRRGREEEEHRRDRRSRSNRGSSSSRQRGGGQNTSDYPPDQGSNQFNYPGGLANNVTPPSQDAASSSNLAQSSTLDATQRRPAYLLHRDLVIGKGSYGQVCIASRGEAEGHHSNKSGKRKKFACKCVMLRNDPKYIAKLQEEVNVLRELRGHDNVIRLFDVFCVDNELFIITELGRGGDLFHLLTTHPKHGVTEAYAAKTVAEMLSAVSFLHSRHIVHRDLKLENWVLESGKDVWSPLKLIDFGLSTHYTPGHRLSRVVGSSYYVAPEVLKKSYTEACDLWSLGVIVYMLLSGAPPFYGKNDEAIKASIVHGEYQFPHELFRDVSDDAMAFVSCLLSYSIEYRYTAEQALTHPWLKGNCDPDQLQRAKDGARGTGAISDGYAGADINAMQM
eukprot:CAMPEP_0201867414 /NCGR_PEP_ID=MMETSP0902-20130614/1645_1 /ASSEMBLY_ACC=CAM_ASM_000551 /TAXON_ID=420261 /ORGANISM="Thalassiosira antarctica, Strain CCMP982" /LENGTH=474 /DNA_ID=CAMNT_0048392561 /DNA_START=413 /DNA_END=1837 /DNA_ORIENTATION=-